MKDIQTHYMLTHAHVYKVKIVITNSCCRQKIFGEFSKYKLINACTLQNHCSGKFPRQTPSHIRCGSSQSSKSQHFLFFSAKLSIYGWVHACLPTSLSCLHYLPDTRPLINSTAEIIFFFNLFDLITGHHELLLGCFFF